jgi:hypothetical protein
MDITVWGKLVETFSLHKKDDPRYLMNIQDQSGVFVHVITTKGDLMILRNLIDDALDSLIQSGGNK